MQTTSPRRYYPPITPRTGALHQQPQASDTQHGWFLDAHCAYTDAGFLDATEIIPTGGHRALDTGSLTLGLAHTFRDGWLA